MLLQAVTNSILEWSNVKLFNLKLRKRHYLIFQYVSKGIVYKQHETGEKTMI